MLEVETGARRRRETRVATWLGVILLACTAAWSPSRASAFTEPRTYYDDALGGGGGGRWFTGSPAEGYACSVCHTGPGPESLTIEGLPEDGYVPGQTYEIHVAWPEFAERAAEIRAEGEEPASMGLVAELVAETGEASGRVRVALPAEAEPGELCVLPEGVQAAKVFRVRPGEETVEEIIGCNAASLGQRCLVAVLSCGAEELNLIWTAPDGWQGPIWLSMGFVATERVSGDPTGDAVTEVAIPLLPAASGAERYETRLSGGCAVATRGGGAAASASALLALAVLLLGLRRRRR